MSKGLPGRLPAGERLLWQGSPSWRTLLRSMFHIRAVAAYFAIIIAWCAASYLRNGDNVGEVGLSVLRMSGVALVPLVLMVIYALLLQPHNDLHHHHPPHRAAPWRGIPHVHQPALRAQSRPPRSRRTLTAAATSPSPLTDGSKVALLAVWPNARPWRMRNPEPMLRGIKDAASVAQILSRALAASAEMPVSARNAVASQPAGANGANAGRSGGLERVPPMHTERAIRPSHFSRFPLMVAGSILVVAVLGTLRRAPRRGRGHAAYRHPRRRTHSPFRRPCGTAPSSSSTPRTTEPLQS